MARPTNLLEALARPGALPPNELAALTAWVGTFYPFQREWLLEPARFALCLKSRQIGISHTTAACAVLWGAFLGETATIISVGEREALEVLEKAKRHSIVLTRLGSTWARHRAMSEEVTFVNGGRVIALPASSGGRSFSGNVFLDEFAYVQRPERVWDGASAVTMHGYRMRVASTPDGMDNAFANLWHSDASSRGYARHTFTLQRALDEGMKVSLDDCWKMAKGDKRLFAQLFECCFLLSGRSFFDADRMLAMDQQVREPRETLAVKRDGAHGDLRIWYDVERGQRYVIACDPSEGVGGDAAAAVVLERGTGRHMATLWGQFRPVEFARAIVGAAKRYNGAEIVVERINHGHAVLAALQLEHKYPRVFSDRDGRPGWINSEATRTPALDNLEEAHRNGHFSTHDARLCREMRTFIVTKNGRAEAAPSAHDDVVMATAIGWNVICRTTTNYGLVNLPPG